MAAKCTAVVRNPSTDESELYEFKVTSWYEAFDQLIVEIQHRHRVQGWHPDDLELTAFAMIYVED